MIRSLRSKLFTSVGKGRRAESTLVEFNSKKIRYHLEGGRHIPSTTTTLQLHKLPASTTQSQLADSLKGVNARKVELEPGCAIHTLNEAHANYVIGKIAPFGINRSDCMIAQTTMPSVVLDNIPDTISVDELQSCFDSFSPKVVQIFGGPSVQLSIKSEEGALAAVKTLDTISVHGHALKTRINATNGKNGYSITVFGFPATGSNAEDAKAAIEKAVPEATSVSIHAGQAREIQLRYTARSEGDASGLRAVIQASLGDIVTAVSEPVHLKRPTLQVKNVGNYTEAELRSVLCDKHKATNIQLRKRSKDAALNKVVAYFDSEAAAFAALSQLRGTAPITGKPTLAVRFVHAAEPVVHVSGLPRGITEVELNSHFSKYEVNSMTLTPEKNEAILVMNCHNQARLAIAANDGKTLTIVGSTEEAVLRVRSAFEEGCDVGVNLTLAAGSCRSLEDIMASLGDKKAASALLKTNISAEVSFTSLQQAQQAQEKFLKGAIALKGNSGDSNVEGGLVTSKLSVTPSYTVEVLGLDVETPVIALEEAVSKEGLCSVVGIDRQAILKFRRHLEIVPAQNALRRITLPGADSRVEFSRFRADVRDGTSEYDVNHDADGSDEAFDTFSLKSVLQDFMGADPGLRMQIARNAFERALSDAKALNDISYILQTNASPALREEATNLLKAPPSRLVTSRLFDLYVQRDDMQKFTHDFKEMTSMLGDANDENPFDWSEFKLTGADDLMKLKEEMDKIDAQAAFKFEKLDGSDETKHVVVQGNTIKGSNKVAAAKDGVMMVESDGQEVPVSLEDPSMLTDRDGRLWSGAILNTDMVQKTMPGGRVGTHRALVVIGNMRGAAGFGMGKGQTPPDAINSAFRSALRNLTHIDLFDNFGLAHDVYGKHNSCKVYVKATPRSRTMVASPFATAILQRFGISSASVKIVGRRDPYAQVRAIFNAIGSHENIDEFAKDRGQRYLSLKWLYDQNV